MNVTAIKKAAERKPFRPFAIRLNNGIRYTFREARDFGAPRDYRDIIFFGKSGFVLIDRESIAEIIQL
jgi:hypothetical protein